MWPIFLFGCLFFKASASQISGSGNTTAEYGGEAYYKCKLNDPTGVLQVTWQRLFKDNSIENLATYSKRFGQQVNEPYLGKITFTEASFHSTSITVRNLTWGDESCYICSFNAYPDGSKRHQTCLKVQGVSEVRTQVYNPAEEPEDEDTEVVFSCSATGKPAPNIQWEYSPHATVVHQTPTSVLTKDDQTFISSKNITLRLSPGWDGHVDCLINKGMIGQKRESITYTRKKGKMKEKDEETPTSYIVLTVILVTLLPLIVVAAFLVFKRFKHPTRNDFVI